MLRQTRAVVCDFDGTLVDSNAIKWRAFETVFAEFADRLPEIMAYCRGCHHVPRHEKFRHVVERILGRPYTPELERRYLAQYAAATTHAIIGAPEIPGATAFIRRVRSTHVTGVLSSTPHQVLEEILMRRGLRSAFDEVRGAPVQKAAWLREFSAYRSFEPREVVFLGDTPEYAAAAEAAGCEWIGVGVGVADHAEIVLEDFKGLGDDEH